MADAIFIHSYLTIEIFFVKINQMKKPPGRRAARSSIFPDGAFAFHRSIWYNDSLSLRHSILFQRGIAMYEIAICDDDAVFLDRFRRQLTAALERRDVPARLTAFSGPSALLKAIEDDQKFDLLFLDVVYARSEQGIRLAGLLKKREYPADIIFMSTNPEYAVASYDVEAIHYLVKPVEDGRLDAALDRFLSRNRADRVSFVTPHGSFYLHLADILYFEIYSHEILIHMADGSSESYVGTLKELEGRLPAHMFVRPHRSYLVNLDYITKIVRHQIFLTSGASVPVSKGLYQQVQRAFIDRAGRRGLSL